MKSLSLTLKGYMNNHTQGIVFFAHNNQHVDYVKQAVFSATQAKKHLNKSVTLITSNKKHLYQHYAKHAKVFDNIIEVDDYKTSQTKNFNDGPNHIINDHWKNHLRSTAYELSPYDETIVMDTDYIICNKNLLKCFQTKEDLLIHKKAVYLNYYNKIDHMVTTLSDSSIDMYWATVFYFKKTPKIKKLFELIAHVKENWDFYRFINQIIEPAFRNDYAFSIAIHNLNGYQKDIWPYALPDKLYYVTDKDIPESFNEDAWTFLLYNSDKSVFKTVSKDINVHIMNKLSLDRIIHERMQDVK